MRSLAGSDKDWKWGQADSKLIHERSPSNVKSAITATDIEKKSSFEQSRRPKKGSKRLCSRLPALIDTPGQMK